MRQVISLMCVAAGSMLLCGCNSESTAPQKPVVEAAKPAEVAEPPAAPRPNLLKRKTQEVVDKNKAMADNPALIEVENKINAQDPLTGALQGYIAASSRINVLSFQHQVNLMKAMEDRNPTYDEIIKLIKESNMEFNALPDYQTFAYDETEGRFLILEDPAAKDAFQNQQ